MINNRQTGRRRGRGGQRSQGGNPGRPDNGNRIDNRARGNAAQLLEKYKSLARDAQMQGDRVNTEYYLQFADHYFRVLNESRSRFEDQQQRRGPQDGFDGDDDDDFDADGFGDERSESDRQRDGNRSDGGRNDGGRSDGNRNEGDRQRADGNRSDGNRSEGGYGDGNREPRPPRANREYREQRDYRDRDQAPRPVQAQGDAPALNGAAHPAPAGDATAEAEERPRRGRPRRAAPIAQTGTDHDDAPAPLGIDRLPPAIGATDAGNDGEGEDAPKPRRRRARTTAEPAAN